MYETAKETLMYGTVLWTLGEREGRMIWENGIETCIISYMKRIASPGLMYDTGCSERPSADEWIRKQWYVYTMEYYSAIKKNTFESVLMRWMKLEPIIQSEVSQKEKHKCSILTHIYGI